MSSADVKRLAVFRAILATGGVNAAARALHRSPSAVSYDLQRLEQALGTALLRKHGRRLLPTDAGQALAQAIERAYLDLQQAWDDVLRPDPPQPLRLASVSGFGRYRLAPALLRALGGQRRLELQFGTAEQVQAMIEQGRATLGIAYRPLVGAVLGARVIADEELVLVGPRTRRRPPSPAELGTLQFVTYDEYDYVFLQWFQVQQLALPQPWRRGDHFGELEEALEAVAAGRGWSVVPADAALAPAFARRVRIVHPTTQRCRNAVYLAGRDRDLDGDDARLLAAVLAAPQPG